MPLCLPSIGSSRGCSVIPASLPPSIWPSSFPSRLPSFFRFPVGSFFSLLPDLPIRSIPSSSFFQPVRSAGHQVPSGLPVASSFEHPCRLRPRLFLPFFYCLFTWSHWRPRFSFRMCLLFSPRFLSRVCFLSIPRFPFSSCFPTRVRALFSSSFSLPCDIL